MRDEQHADAAFLGHLAKQAEHLVCFGWSQHARRLIQDDDPAPQIELLQDLELLLLAGRKLSNAALRIDRKRHTLHERLDPGQLEAPVDDRRNRSTTENEIFHDRHVLDQREVLIDHADGVGVRVAGARQRDGNAVDADLACVRAIEAHDALHQSALAGAVLPEEGVHRSGLETQRRSVEHGDTAEALRHIDRLEEWRPRNRVRGRGRHRRAVSSAGMSAEVSVAELETSMMIKVRTYGAALNR